MNMRFAKVGEEVLTRHDELTGEELRLYLMIVFHTFIDTGLCRRSIKEISRIHGLNYNHSTERYKRLRQKGWCRNEKGGIRPLVGFRTPKNGVYELQKTEYETPKNGVPNSKKRSFETAKTPKNGVSLIPYTEPLNSEPLNTHTENGVRVNSDNGRKSNFSLEECIRYAELCKASGDDIKSPLALGKSIYESGEFDSRIKALLYPEPPAEVDGDGPLHEALQLLLDVKNAGFEIDDYEKWYTPEEWQWLMQELSKHASS